MADQATIDAVTKLLEGKLGQLGLSGCMPAGEFMAPAGASPGSPALTGVSFRAKVPLPNGMEVNVQLQFSAAGVHSAQDLQLLAMQVSSLWPVEAYPPKQQGGWGGQGGGGSWGQSGGGWNRGGSYGGSQGGGWNQVGGWRR